MDDAPCSISPPCRKSYEGLAEYRKYNDQNESTSEWNIVITGNGGMDFAKHGKCQPVTFYETNQSTNGESRVTRATIQGA
jgi:hypothetical protein